MDIFTLAGKIMIDTAAADQSLSKTGETADKTGDKMIGLGGKMKDWGSKIKTVITGLAIGATIKKGFDIAKQAVTDFADKGDDIDKMSQKFSMSAEAYQKWESIAGHNGTSIETIGRSIKTITGSLEKNKEAYEALGVSVTNADGSLRDSQDIFQDTILALSDMEAGTQRDAMAKELLGGKYQELLPLINGGRDAILQQLDAANQAVTMTDEQVKQAAAYKDAQQAMQEQIDKVKMSLVSGLVPALVSCMTWLSENIPKVTEFLHPVIEVVNNVVGTIIDNVGQIISAIGELTPKISEVGTSNDETMQKIKEIWDKIKEIFTTVFDAIKQLVQAFISAFQGFWDKYGATISAKAKEILNAILDFYNAYFGFIIKAVQTFISGFTAFWKKYGDSILSFIKPIWEQIKNVFNTAFNVIKDVLKIFTAAFQGDWKGCWEAVKQLIADIWDGIKNTVKNALDMLVNIIKGIGGAFKAAGKAIFSALWDGIKSVWESIKGWVEDKVKWIADKLTFWKKSKAEMSDSGTKHAGGINSVPYDNYPAMLHKGERVLTASENNRYNDQSESSAPVRQININMYYPQVTSKNDIKTISRQLKEQISQGDRALGLVY